MQQYDFPRPIYSKDLKDIPERLWPHEWIRTVDFNKLPRYQLKVRMCCPKCEEKVKEEIWEVRGVVDVEAFRADKKVVVTGMPEYPETGLGYEGRDGFLDTDQVLRRARKIDCRARFVHLDHPVAVAKPQPPKGTSGNQPAKFPSGSDQPKQKPKAHPDQMADLLPVMHPSSGSSFPAAYSQDPPYSFFRDPAGDDNTPFYFLLFVILLLSLLVFRK